MITSKWIRTRSPNARIINSSFQQEIDLNTTYKHVCRISVNRKQRQEFLKKNSKDTPKTTSKRNLPIFVIYDHVSLRGLKIQYQKNTIRQELKLQECERYA